MCDNVSQLAQAVRISVEQSSIFEISKDEKDIPGSSSTKLLLVSLSGLRSLL